MSGPEAIGYIVISIAVVGFIIRLLGAIFGFGDRRF